MSIHTRPTSQLLITIGSSHRGRCRYNELRSLPELKIVTPLNKNAARSRSSADRRSNRSTLAAASNGSNYRAKCGSNPCAGCRLGRLVVVTDLTFVIYGYRIAVCRSNGVDNSLELQTSSIWHANRIEVHRNIGPS